MAKEGPVKWLRREFDSLHLQTKLVIMMLCLLFFSLAAYLYFHTMTERALLRQVEDEMVDLSTAIQISVEELTTHGVSDEARLRAYVNRMKKKGFREISILGKQKQVIASSNPLKKGATLDVMHKEPDRDLMIRAVLGEPEPGDQGKTRNLIVPVIVGNEQLGYIHIALHMEDFKRSFRALFFRRLAITLLIFIAGIAATIILSKRYTKPIYDVVTAAQKVASGDLTEIPMRGRKDEIGELTSSFNEMVEKLRENQELQEKLRKSEHLSQLGRLASGIAHEIRNPLNFINLSIDHISSRFSPRKNPEEFRRLVTTMKEEVRRLNDMVSGFLTLGKPISLSLRPVSLASLLQDILRVIQRRIAEQKVSVKKNIQSDMPLLHVDPEQIRTCFMNVLLNALQAMPSGGKLTISGEKDGDGFLSVSFSDTGEGIPKEQLSRIFEPYFTTRSAGIGLGLAITKRIVEEHGGEILIRSEIAKGTTVVFRLPVSS